jgi:hypothetical protein
MAEWLKRGATAQAKADHNRKVRDTVEGIFGADDGNWHDR